MSKIITINDLNGYIGSNVSNDPRATAIVAAVNDWVESYTGRVVGEVKTVTDVLDYAPVVFVAHPDITEVTEVKLFGDVLDGDDYRMSLKTGRLVLSLRGRNRNLRSDYDQVEVTYKTGIAEVPADLKGATLQLAADNYARKDAEGAGVTAESIDGYSIQYGKQQETVDAQGNHRISDPMAVFNFYKVRRLG